MELPPTYTFAQDSVVYENNTNKSERQERNLLRKMYTSTRVNGMWKTAGLHTATDKFTGVT